MTLKAENLQYSKAFLLSLASSSRPDAGMLETIRSLNISREYVPPQGRDSCETVAIDTNAVKPPNGRKPFTPIHVSTTSLKSLTYTPAARCLSAVKENLVNQDTKKMPASVQKPLQTSKSTPKPLQVAPKPPIPATPPKILTLPSDLSLSPGSPAPELEPLSPSQMETDPHRLSQRQKQITYGYRTLGYLRYRLLVPRDKRRKEHPRTPRKEQICSKRSWDGQVKKWRRELHKWDPALDSGFQELLTADILESMFAGVPGLSELITGLKEKLAQGTLGQIDDEEEADVSDLPSPSGKSVTPEKTSVVKTLVF